ncbi:hypothetical protein AB0M20_05425 [Actinoplanes sp. NPDC051633]|uniref:hypothetical protein n=1 Tax=Actinoplanes sp. NPDC051633 TaxID=3155670 RepID=UPI0034308649
MRSHASNVDRLRTRLERVRADARRIGEDQSAFGLVCGWVLTGLGDRYVRHDQLMAYIEESLALVVRGLRRVAAGEERLGDWLGLARGDAPVAYDRPQSMSHVVDHLLELVERREWVEPELELAPVAEFVAPVEDDFGALRVGGLRWAMAYAEPVRQMLDDLSGTPEIAAGQATRWTAMAGDLNAIAADLRRCLDRDFAAPAGPDVRAYLDLMSNNVEALKGVAATATAMALVTRSAADLILLTRDIVRGLIGTLLARVIVWTADTSAVVTRDVMAARLATVVATTRRIHAYITALVASVANLSEYVDD